MWCRRVRGLALSRGFYHEVVRPLLADIAPDLHCSAALIGPGSEVLGYDDETSTDHHWGPRVLIFCKEADARSHGDRVSRELANRLPHRYGGYPTDFTEPDPNDNGTQLLRATAAGPVNHRVEIVPLGGWVAAYLGLKKDALPPDEADWTREAGPAIDAIDWLTLPQQKLLTIVAGEVFHDDGGRLTALRRWFAWYPDDVWRYLLASVWTRLGQEEHLVGRAGQAGDEPGARIIASRIVRDMMRLCFLLERRYAPYPKWLGTGFRELDAAGEMAPLLDAVLTAGEWRSRNAALIPCWEAIARLQNRAGLMSSLPDRVAEFFGRPFHVMAIHGFAEALLSTITSDWLTPTMRRSPVGGIDLFTDNTDLLEDPAYREGVRALLTSGD